MDWIDIKSDPSHVLREKQKAKRLKKSQWWRNKVNDGKCHYCEKHHPPEEITMDHVVPLSRGGKSTKGNVVPCCKTCNSEKKYLTPVEIALNNLKES